MAIYHFSAKTVKRSDGRSAVASSAYRACECIEDTRRGVICDYTKKQDLVYAEILAPTNSPDWIKNRAILWNKVEHTEVRKDAQLAREIEIALPVELSQKQQITLVRLFVISNFVSKGMVADICIHDPDREPKNPHAHIMLTMRDITKDGFGQKNRDWNDKELLNQWREEWAKSANAALALQNHEARIDHRSHKERGLDEMPTIKLGSAVCALEKKGIETAKGNYNREIKKINEKIKELAKGIKELVKPAWDMVLESMRISLDEREKAQKQREKERQAQKEKDKGIEMGD